MLSSVNTIPTSVVLEITIFISGSCAHFNIAAQSLFAESPEGTEWRSPLPKWETLRDTTSNSRRSVRENSIILVGRGFTGRGKNRRFGNGSECCTSKTTCADQTKSKTKYSATFRWNSEFPAIIRCGGYDRWWIAGWRRCGVILRRCMHGAGGRRSRRSDCCGRFCCKRCTRFAARRN